MKKLFFVYSRNGDTFPILSSIKLPDFLMYKKQKYVGKKAKIEAVLRLSNIRLLSTLTSQQINEYIAENIFNTSLWVDYYEIYKEISSEFDVLSEKYELNYTVSVEFNDLIVDIADQRFLYLLTQELLGFKFKEYNGLENPIISFNRL